MIQTCCKATVLCYLQSASWHLSREIVVRCRHDLELLRRKSLQVATGKDVRHLNIARGGGEKMAAVDVAVMYVRVLP